MKEEIFRKFLKDRGKRLTRERAAILKKTSSSKGHFDPESLYLEMKKKDLKISKASVYRTLHLLCECGLIEKVRKTEHGSTIYEHTFGQGHHDHMLCTECGKVIEFYSDNLERLQEEICKEYGFQWTTHTLEIRGYCSSCQKEIGKRKVLNS